MEYWGDHEHSHRCRDFYYLPRIVSDVHIFLRGPGSFRPLALWGRCIDGVRGVCHSDGVFGSTPLGSIRANAFREVPEAIFHPSGFVGDDGFRLWDFCRRDGEHPDQ